MELQTERLLLRPFRQEDLHDFYEYAKHLEVGPNAGWKPHESLAETQKILDMFMTGKDTIFAVTLKNSGKVIGSVGLHEDACRHGVSNCKMLGYVLSADYWGQGLMPEAAGAVIDYAFADPDFMLLSCSHFSFNQRSKRVIEKLGFVYEGCLRHAYRIYNGVIADSCCYAMTRTDYYAHKAEQAELRLVLPEQGDFKADYLAYLAEWPNEINLNPRAGFFAGEDYESWLAESIQERTNVPQDFVTATTYFLVDKSNHVLAVSSLRHTLTEALLQSGGHIGYGVRPSERGNGYAKLLLALTLQEAKKIGINSAMLSCKDDNLASAKTIEALGGKLEDKQINYKNLLMRRYWIAIL